MNAHTTQAEDTRHEVVGAILDELVQESADEVAIAAIGDLGADTYLRPGRNGLDVYGDRDDSRPYTTIPRGLSPETARLLVDFWHRGYEAGLRNGAGEIQRGIRRLLAIA